MTLERARARRKRRIRKKVSGTSARPRLTVFRSAKHIYAQIVNDLEGRTLAAASTVAKGDGSAGGEGDDAKAKVRAAMAVGSELAKACQAQGIERVVFDRNGYLYHGRIKALADGARKAGLVF